MTDMQTFFQQITGTLANNILGYLQSALPNLFTVFAVVMGVGLIISVVRFLVQKI